MSSEVSGQGITTSEKAILPTHLLYSWVHISQQNKMWQREENLVAVLSAEARLCLQRRGMKEPANES